MTETPSSSEPEGGTEKPDIAPPADAGKGKPWIKIIAILIVIALVSLAAYYLVFMTEEEWSVVIDPETVEMDAGALIELTATVMKGSDPASDEFLDNCEFMWSMSDSSLGSFSYRARPITNFTAAIEEGDGTLTCTVTYTNPDSDSETVKEATIDLTIDPPYLDSISITPSSKRLDPSGGSAVFTATAMSSVALPISNLAFSWSISGLAGMVLNATTGTSVTVTAGSTEGLATLSASATYMGSQKTGTANISVAPPPPRTVDYRWYDMFNCSFGQWWDSRARVYGIDVAITHEFPYYFRYYTSPINIWDYTMMRLDFHGKNVSEVNMNEHPTFLPVLSNTERGGTAVLNWQLKYLTTEEMQVYPDATAAWDDGWVVRVSGTSTLDKQAAKTVLNLTETGYNDFDSWWTQYKSLVKTRYTAWLVEEAALESPTRHMDIYNAYEYALTLLAFELEASKVGSNVVLTIDIVSWGMEILMTRWMHNSFMETEWYFDSMTFNAAIGPEWMDVDATAVIDYAAYAELGTLNNDLVWGWESLLQDYIPSTPPHPVSDMDPYVGKQYLNQAPGSPLFGTMMDYDYAPTAWNLTAGETLRLESPSEVVKFRMHRGPGDAIDYPGHIFINYSEPNDTDLPGQVITAADGSSIEFIGPIDMWSWSNTQTTHAELASEWARLGVLPYGAPFIEFEILEPVFVYPDSIRVTAVPTVPADDLFDVTVTILDQLGGTYLPWSQDADGYTGTIHFSSNDTGADLPPDYTFQTSDLGVKTFTGVSLATTGVRSIRVVDAANSSTNGSASVVVTAKRAANHIGIDVYHMPSVGVAEDVTVTVYDQYDDVFLNYTGIVTFSSNATPDVVLPSNYQFLAGDHGVHTIPAGVTYNIAGWADLNATDTITSTVRGSQTDINVTAVPEQVGRFSVTVTPSDLLAGQYPDVRIVAHNQWGLQFLRYSGTVVFSSNATPDVTLPASYTFVAADRGDKTLSSISYGKSGTFNLVVTDSLNGATGTATGIKVQLRPQERTFKMFDMMEEPFWPFWDWRYNIYQTDQVLWREPHKNVLAYSATKQGDQIALQVPYRWNVTAKNISTMHVHNPVVLPTIGPANVPGAHATVDVYSQYIYDDWWNSYWVPTWSGEENWVPGILNSQKGDGWYLGTIYNVTMNRAAAEEWINLAQSEADPMDWWNRDFQTNKYAYYDYFASTWVGEQANSVYDIFNGYETPYSGIVTMMYLGYDSGTGLVNLKIAHINWGWEVLIAKWLSAMGVNHHELYYDNVTLTFDYGPLWSDVTFEGSAQYNMKAVRRYSARAPETTECAWAWQPYRIDYINSSDEHPGSAFDPWGAVKYYSNNSGDPKIGKLINYDSALQWFNLSAGDKFIIQLRTDNNVLCFKGQGVPLTAWDSLYAGDKSDFTALMVNGTMSLGYVSDARITAGYNAGTKTITLVGPMSFDNADKHPNGVPVEGAPYIEFNVDAVGGGTSIPEPAPIVGSGSSMNVFVLMAMAVAVLSTLAAIFAATREKR